jgi:hypothetical protein
LRFSFFENKEVSKVNLAKYKILNLFDNFIVKQFIAFFLILKQKLSKKSKIIKQVVFVFLIFLSLF